MTKREVKNIICGELNVKKDFFDGKEDKNLSEMGIDSLDKIECLLLMEDKFNIEVDARANQVQTLNSIFVILKEYGLED